MGLGSAPTLPSGDPGQSDARTPLLPPQEEAHAPDGSSAYAGCPPEHHHVHRNRDARTLPDGPPPPIHTHAQAHPELTPRPSTTIHQQVIVVHSSSWPPRITCPHCHRQGPTIQYRVSGFCTWFTAWLCCLMGCCILFPFAFCCDPLKDTVHYCAHCRRYIGRTPA